MDFKSYIIKKKFLFFFLISFFLYGNTLKNEYGLDDSYVTSKTNLTAKGLKSVKTIFTTHYIVEEGGTNTFEYRPLVKLSFAIEHQFFGVKPWISHFFNLLLYACFLFVLFKIVRLLFPDYPEYFSLLIVIVYAFLPIHVEVVAGLKSRDILLSSIFSGLSFLQAYSYIKENKIKYLIGSFLCLTISFFSKLDALPFIVLIPLFCFLHFRSKKLNIFLLLISLIISFFTFDTLMSVLIDQSLENRPLEAYENPLYFEHSFIKVISTALNSVGFYTKMLFFPNNMACYYGFNTIAVNDFNSFYSITGILTIILSLFYWIKYLKNYKHPVFIGITFYFICLTLYLNILKPAPGIVADRFLFTPSIGFAIIFTYVIFHLSYKKNITIKFSQWTILSKTLLFVFLIMNTFFVIKRNYDWKNEVTLFYADADHQPNSVKLNNLCGNQILAELQKKDGSIPENEKPRYLKVAQQKLEKALQIDSNNIKALNNLSYLHLNFYKNYNEAKKYIVKAYAKDSLKHEIVFNLALCNYNIGDLNEAKKFIKIAFILKPDDNYTLELMTEIFSNPDTVDEGINLIQNKLISSPQNFKLNLLLGNLFLAKRDTLNAVNFLKAAYNTNPNDKQLGEMVRILSQQ